MTLLHSDELFDAQATRALAYAGVGAATIGEVARTTAKITRTDIDLWYSEWFATASRVRAIADAALQAGKTVSARDAYFRASNYYRTAGGMILQAPVDARLLEAQKLQTETFRSGAALLDLPPDILEIPYQEGLTLPAYFFRVADDGKPRPTVILIDGYDGTVEELYFANGVAALERGYNVLAFDGPGQGAMIIERGIPFRPDWENVVRPVVDFALTLPDVDASRIALHGWSFGGYLAPRAATGDPRIAACIADCGPYDLATAVFSRMPAALAKQVQKGNALALKAVDALLGSMMKKPTAGWGLRRNLLVHGLSDPLELLKIASEYTLRGREAFIRCPTFVTAAETDDLSALAKNFFDALTCEKDYSWFTTDEGAGAHCEMTNRPLYHQRAYDWLDRVLSRTESTPTGDRQ